MELNLDNILGKWDFPVTFNGLTFQTTAPLLETLAALGQIQTAKTTDEVCDTVALLFSDPPERVRPWLAEFPPQIRTAMVKAVLDYMTESMTKNSQAIAEAVKAAMASSGSSGPSTQP